MPNFPYYKLAKWDARALTFREIKGGFRTVGEARVSATREGKYRISSATPSGWVDIETFDVRDAVEAGRGSR
jgi:hypothetical protein